MGDASMTTPPPPPGLGPPSSSSGSRATPVREDCWSEEATATLIEAWGRRYVELNRGNLRQKDWQEVADSVNALHGLTKKTHRTDVQCKNRIDTIKKKYKLEKAKPSSSWSFFHRLDSLIVPKKPTPTPTPTPPPSSSSPPLAVPLLPFRNPSDDGFFRRNYSAMAAAAAAGADTDDDDDDDENDAADADEEEEDDDADLRDAGTGIGAAEGMRRLARAISRFGDVYEKVEAEKLRHMVDLEKQRMQFAKDLEVQRMRMFMDTQVQLERIKRAKRSASNDLYG